MPSEKTLLNYTPPATTKIFSSENELIEEYAIEHRVVAKFDEIPIIIKGAFLIAEDQDFYNHSGISIKSLTRAIIENTAQKSWNKKPAGGSTITQQIAKNILVGSKRSISRKIKEAIMAFRIESRITKNKILEIYLNQIYLGRGCYGIVEASNKYFNKHLKDLTPAEAAFIAAIPSAPSVYINALDSLKLTTKKNAILFKMHEFGYISKKQLKESLTAKIQIKNKKQKIFSPYFSDAIFKIISNKITQEEFFKRGLFIKTTLNKKIQNMLTESFEDEIINYTNNQTWKGTIENVQDDVHEYKEKLQHINKYLPITINKIQSCIIESINENSISCSTIDSKIKVNLKNSKFKNLNLKINDIVLIREIKETKTHELYQTPEITGGAMILDCDTGEILGITGGYSFDISTFNCITQSKRQPGSTIKPFVYAAAIENGMDEFDTIEDKPVAIKLSNGKIYTPQNYSKKSFGKTYLRDGLIYSRNLSTINLALKIGIKPISKILKSANLIQNKLPISGVLGSIEVTPINLFASFSAFFNDGIMVFPKFIKNINNQTDRPVENCLKKLTNTRKKRIISKETANTIKKILIDAAKFGTSSKLSEISDKYEIEIAGKTGSTNDFKDAWFVGCFKFKNKKYIFGSFVGHQNNTTLGENCSGARIALPIFKTFLKKFLNN